MKLPSILAFAAAGSLMAAPALAAPSPAAPLSLAHATSVRAGSPSGTSDLAGGVGLFGLLIAAGVVAILVVAVADNNDSPDSN